MNDRQLRNHPTVIIRNSISVVIIVAVIMFSFFENGVGSLGLFALVVMVASIILILVLSWARTTISFEDDEIITEHNLFYKKKKTIPYSKIASVNVTRNVFDRVFGTTTLSININSSRNASIPEASFAFKTDLADRIRSELTAHIFDQNYNPAKEHEFESVMKFTSADAVLHGIIGTPTWQLAYTFGFLAYSIFSLIFLEAGGFVISFIMLICGGIIPIASLIIRYANFKVYRVDDTIRLQHGAIQTYRTSFDIARINAVRVRRPLFARMMHKACLEAEVVGISPVGGDKATTPMLCLMVNEDKLPYIMEKLIPEFMVDIPREKQPKQSVYPMLFKSTIFSAVTACITAAYLVTANPDPLSVKFILPSACALMLIVLSYVSVFLSMKHKEIGFGDDMFEMVNGIVDTYTMTIQYDRIQISEISASTMVRKLGLGKCTVSLLSSAGQHSVRTGYFSDDELEKISKTMLDRLKSK